MINVRNPRCYSFVKIFLNVVKKNQEVSLLKDDIFKLKSSIDFGRFVSLSKTISLLGKDKIIDFFTKLANELNLSKNTKEIFLFLVQQKAVGLLKDVLLLLEQGLLDALGYEEAAVETSHQLSELQRIDIEKMIKERLKKEVKISFNVNKKLIIGLRIATTTHLFEKSFAKDLSLIESKLKFGI